MNIGGDMTPYIATLPLNSSPEYNCCLYTQFGKVIMTRYNEALYIM